MDNDDRIKILFNIVFRLLLLIAAVTSYFNKNWFHVIISILTFGITFLPSFFEKKFKVDYPSDFEITITVFIFLSLFLGEMNYFYAKFWWWDLFLHGLAGVIIANFGFTLIYILNHNKRIMKYLSPGFTAIFVFSFSQAASIIWELYEYSMDVVFKLKMMKAGLSDTMEDMFIMLITSLIFSIIGYLYLKYQPKENAIEQQMTKIFKRNKHIFKRSKQSNK